MRSHSTVSLGALLATGMLAACSPPVPDGKADATTDAKATATCTDAEKLPGTGLCPAQALALLDPAVLQTTEILPEGCSWSVNETMMGMDDEAIVYQAASCKGKTTRLEMRAGARSAALGYGVSALYDTLPEDFEPVRIFTTEGQADPKAAILAMAKEATENKAEAATCEIQPFNVEGSPVLADAFIINVTEAYLKEQNIAPEEARAACGPYGITDGQRYWVIRQGYSWFIDWGQDGPDFNPNSLTRIVRGPDGVWARMP
jgi:hypothetical protein